MKSIMQEASSVMKAIEKGWESAGKPKDFSIKVFEEPKKNFIGMTVQTAKIGIFFDEKLTISKEIEKDKPSYVKNTPQPQKAEPTHKPLLRRETPVRPERTEPREFPKPEPVASTAQPVKEVPKTPKIVWTPEMITIASQWLSDILQTLNLSDVGFSTQTSHYQLLIKFNKPLLANDEKEQQLLRSFSLLLIQTLRHKLKRPLRGFKIMMTREA